MTQDEAVTTFNVVRYIKARETYDPKALKDNFDLAQLLATGDAAREDAILSILAEKVRRMRSDLELVHHPTFDASAGGFAELAARRPLLPPRCRGEFDARTRGPTPPG